MERQVVKTDLLCIGGGPAGLMAAIKAAEKGVKVVLADKGNTIHSGSGSGGNDHFECYIPEVHGNDPTPIMKEYLHAPVISKRPEFGKPWIEMSHEIVKLWDSWGIPMKYKGNWEFAGHAFPGRPRIFLKYTGGNQKRVLTEQALKREVQIYNRVTVFDLLREKDRVIGAVGYDTWNDKIIEFQAKAVFLGTGGLARLYPPSTPAWMFNLPFCPVLTGDGRAMALRAGGELSDLEFTGQWAGMKYFARAGKSTWIGVYRTPDDKPVGPFITKPDRLYGDITADAFTTMYDDYLKDGRGPVYQDCRGASDDDIEYMIHWLRNEGNEGIVRHMEEEGIDPRKHAVEFRTYEIGVRGGIWWDINGKTCVPGMYAAGDEYFSGMATSVIYGWRGGEAAAAYIKKAEYGNVNKEDKEKVDRKISLIESFLSRKEGASWQEGNIALQQIMGDYVGTVRSASLLEQANRNLGRLKDKVNKTMRAKTSHEVGRCLEVLNMLDIGEAIIACASERKETRGRHYRTDYPFTNPLLDKFLMVKKPADKFVFEWREK
ncbi:FAD-binding protein [Chloroflexota bacterium]